MATEEQAAMLRAAGWVDGAHRPVRWQNDNISEYWLPEEVALYIVRLERRVQELEEQAEIDRGNAIDMAERASMRDD